MWMLGITVGVGLGCWERLGLEKGKGLLTGTKNRSVSMKRKSS